jgi:DNA-binding MarR family transcriptional regulator
MSIDLKLLGRAIKQIQHRHHRTLDAGLSTIGTTLAQWDALHAIGRHPGISAHKLALETFQSDQAFGTLANRLTTRGLIERKPGLGRRIEHHLTHNGQKTLDAGHKIASQVLEASFANLSESEREQLLNLLLRIIQNAPE